MVLLLGFCPPTQYLVNYLHNPSSCSAFNQYICCKFNNQAWMPNSSPNRCPLLLPLYALLYGTRTSLYSTTSCQASYRVAKISITQKSPSATARLLPQDSTIGHNLRHPSTIHTTHCKASATFPNPPRPGLKTDLRKM